MKRMVSRRHVLASTVALPFWLMHCRRAAADDVRAIPNADLAGITIDPLDLASLESDFPKYGIHSGRYLTMAESAELLRIEAPWIRDWSGILSISGVVRSCELINVPLDDPATPPIFPRSYIRCCVLETPEIAVATELYATFTDGIPASMNVTNLDVKGATAHAATSVTTGSDGEMVELIHLTVRADSMVILVHWQADQLPADAPSVVETMRDRILAKVYASHVLQIDRQILIPNLSQHAFRFEGISPVRGIYRVRQATPAPLWPTDADHVGSDASSGVVAMYVSDVLDSASPRQRVTVMLATFTTTDAADAWLDRDGDGWDVVEDAPSIGDRTVTRAGTPGDLNVRTIGTRQGETAFSIVIEADSGISMDTLSDLARIQGDLLFGTRFEIDVPFPEDLFA